MSTLKKSESLERTENNDLREVREVFSYDKVSNVRSLTPTEQTYTALEYLVEILNTRIVVPCLKNRAGELLGAVPQFITTVNAQGRCKGFAAKSIWSNHLGRYLDQVTVVMCHHKHGDLKDVAATILHEMIHVKQFHAGKPGNGNYHNRQYSNWLKCCGLQTSKTGMQGGADIGTGMSQYIIKGGVFDTELDCLISKGFNMPWEVIDASSLGHFTGDEAPVEPKPKDPSKTRFNCPKCRATRIWGKPSTKVGCQNPSCNNEPLLSEQS